MARVDAQALANHELARVYLAATLREAKEAEELLTQNGVDFVVEVELFGGSLLGTPRHGAVFYVTNAQADYCRSRLKADGLERGVLDLP